MKQLVIMPGGFHPFHAGHYALYQSAQQAFPGADVYVAATADTSERPFPFPLKQKLSKLAGVPADRFVQVKSPFSAQEITAKYDPNTTALIFVRSEKDKNTVPQPAKRDAQGNLPVVTRGPRKGQPVSDYLQFYTGKENLEPMNRHAYIAYLPTVEFGPGMTSATEIRKAWPKLNDKRKTALVMSLYPKTQTNPKLADTVVKMLDTAIGSELAETRIINPKNIDVFYRPIQDSRGKRVVVRNIPYSVLDRLLQKLSDKFGVPEESFEWTAAQPEVDENQGWAATLESECQTAGTPAVGGMWAGYQQRENQPVAEDYAEEKRS
jgi:glycerol-3-phosphate cytidylyltransferase-like family protein